MQSAKKVLDLSIFVDYFVPSQMEMWQSWFNAPDLKSDEGASPPGVRIPTSPPIKKRYLYGASFLLFVRMSDLNPRNWGSTASERQTKGCR